jgi:hypothetical protein
VLQTAVSSGLVGLAALVVLLGVFVRGLWTAGLRERPALAATLAWPSAVVLGANGHGRMRFVAELAARRVKLAGGRFLLCVDADDHGEAAAIAAGRAAMAAGLELDRDLVIVDLSGHPTFRALLSRVREMALEAAQRGRDALDHVLLVGPPKTRSNSGWAMMKAARQPGPRVQYQSRRSP